MSKAPHLLSFFRKIPAEFPAKMENWPGPGPGLKSRSRPSRDPGRTLYPGTKTVGYPLHLRLGTTPALKLGLPPTSETGATPYIMLLHPYFFQDWSFWK